MAIEYGLNGLGDESTFDIPMNVPFGRLLKAIKSIPGCKILSRSYFMWVVDDYFGKFIFDGFEFEIDTIFSDSYIIRPVRKGYPPEAFEKIKKAFDSYRTLWQRIFNYAF